MRELSLNNSRLDGRYDIRNTLGQGSYAEIYVARDILAAPQSPHSVVVIKALNVFLQNDLDADLERTLVENFQNEAIALDRVRHPNIISRLGHGSARDLRNTIFHYLVLEYLPGGDLAKACREKTLNLSKALFYLEQICAGLAHAHKNGIIHRDIKPQNLLLTEDRQTVKIADFGVARVSQSDSPITRVGTNMFAPPEHSPMFATDSDTITYTKLTPAADIYSLAKSAYVLITCESPRFFANHPINELPLAFRQKPWADELVKVLNKATQNDPAQRHQTVNEFWQDLSRIKLLVDAEDGETATQIKSRPHTVPQAHVSKGYTPLAPIRPRFNTSRDLKINNNSISEKAPIVVRLDDLKTNQSPLAQPEIAEVQTSPISQISIPQPRKKHGNFLRRFATFIIFIGLFAGILYATHNYLRGRGILPSVTNPFARQEATALMDINLRSEPDKDSAQIGLVTKDSRLQIAATDGNWYKISIIEQGSQPRNPLASEGWISGKARNGDDTIKFSR
jgi:serine/threonine protein kinase